VCCPPFSRDFARLRGASVARFVFLHGGEETSERFARVRVPRREDVSVSVAIVGGVYSGMIIDSAGFVRTLNINTSNGTIPGLFLFDVVFEGIL
jgi:hypothetical protein